MSTLLGDTRYRVWFYSEPGGTFLLAMSERDTSGPWGTPGQWSRRHEQGGLTREVMRKTHAVWIARCRKLHNEETGQTPGYRASKERVKFKKQKSKVKYLHPRHLHPARDENEPDLFV